MDPNSFVVVPSPSYAAPIVNWFGNQNQSLQKNANQQQQNQQNQQPQQNWGQRLRAWLQQQQQNQTGAPAQMGQQAGVDQAVAAYNNPNLTMRQRVGLDPIDPGSVSGANQLTAGLY